VFAVSIACNNKLVQSRRCDILKAGANAYHAVGMQWFCVQVGGCVSVVIGTFDLQS